MLNELFHQINSTPDLLLSEPFGLEFAGFVQVLAAPRNSSSPVNFGMKDCPSFTLKTSHNAYIS